jgi:hypothetical protein
VILAHAYPAKRYSTALLTAYSKPWALGSWSHWRGNRLGRDDQFFIPDVRGWMFDFCLFAGHVLRERQCVKAGGVFVLIPLVVQNADEFFHSMALRREPRLQAAVGLPPVSHVDLEIQCVPGVRLNFKTFPHRAFVSPLAFFTGERRGRRKALL